MSVDHSRLYAKIAEYTEILAGDPGSAIFAELSEAYRQLGMLDEAVNVARQGLARKPQHVPGLVSLGRTLAQQKNLAAAVEAFERAVTADNSSLTALTGLARVLLMQGNRARANEIAQRIRQIDPSNPIVEKILGSASAAQRPPAPPAAPAMPAQDPPQTDVGSAENGPLATLTIAELYERQGLTDRALKMYRDIARREPDNAAVRQKISHLERQLATEEQPEPVAAAPEPKDDRYLESLNRWLNAIQQRRANV